MSDPTAPAIATPVLDALGAAAQPPAAARRCPTDECVGNRRRASAPEPLCSTASRASVVRSLRA